MLYDPILPMAYVIIYSLLFLIGLAHAVKIQNVCSF